MLPMPPKHAHPDLDRILQTVISIFTLKTFGDYGQELLSVRQSMTTQTVFIGNDWISCIRYLYLMKYVDGAGLSNDWWGGFMGVSGAFLFANLVGFQGGGRRKGKSKRVRKRTKKGKKGKKKSKRTKKRSKKKSKRTKKGKKKSKRK